MRLETAGDVGTNGCMHTSLSMVLLTQCDTLTVYRLALDVQTDGINLCITTDINLTLQFGCSLDSFLQNDGHQNLKSRKWMQIFNMSIIIRNRAKFEGLLTKYGERCVERFESWHLGWWNWSRRRRLRGLDWVASIGGFGRGEKSRNFRAKSRKFDGEDENF